MSIPTITSISPNTGAISGGVLMNIFGSGFFGGTGNFNVLSVTIAGVIAPIQSGGTDTQFQVLTPVLDQKIIYPNQFIAPSQVVGAASIEYPILITTNQGVSNGGPNFTYTIFPEGQDRSIDYKTAQWWCTGCCFLGLKSNPRSSTANATGSWDAIEPSYANTTRAHYYCTSPNVNFKQRISQEMSNIGVGFCPFRESKLQLFFNVSESF